MRLESLSRGWHLVSLCLANGLQPPSGIAAAVATGSSSSFWSLAVATRSSAGANAGISAVSVRGRDDAGSGGLDVRVPTCRWFGTQLSLGPDDGGVSKGIPEFCLFVAANMTCGCPNPNQQLSKVA